MVTVTTHARRPWFASLGELLEDYRDFLYVRDLDEWTPAHPYVRRLSQLCRTPGADYETFRKGIEHDDPAICANVLGGLTRMTIRLLNGQLDRLERDFVTEGGLRERMTRARLEDETVWLTNLQLSQLFNVAKAPLIRHTLRHTSNHS